MSNRGNLGPTYAPNTVRHCVFWCLILHRLLDVTRYRYFRATQPFGCRATLPFLCYTTFIVRHCLLDVVRHRLFRATPPFGCRVTANFGPINRAQAYWIKGSGNSARTFRRKYRAFQYFLHLLSRETQ